MKAAYLLMIFLLLSCRNKDSYELNKISKILDTKPVEAVCKCSFESFSSFNGDGLGAYVYELNNFFIKDFQQKLATQKVMPQSDRDMHYWKVHPWKKSLDTQQDSSAIEFVNEYVLGIPGDKVCKMGVDMPIKIGEDMVYSYLIKGDSDHYLDGVELYILDYRKNLIYIYEAYM